VARQKKTGGEGRRQDETKHLDALSAARDRARVAWQNTPPEKRLSALPRVNPRVIAKRRAVPVSAAFCDTGPEESPALAPRDIRTASARFLDEVAQLAALLLTAGDDGDLAGLVETRVRQRANEIAAAQRRTAFSGILAEEIEKAHGRALVRCVVATLTDGAGAAVHRSPALGERFGEALATLLDRYSAVPAARRGRRSENDDLALYLRFRQLMRDGKSEGEAVASLRPTESTDDRSLRRRIKKGRQLADFWCGIADE
jgi:hypothetical protein